MRQAIWLKCARNLFGIEPDAVSSGAFGVVERVVCAFEELFEIFVRVDKADARADRDFAGLEFRK